MERKMDKGSRSTSEVHFTNKSNNLIIPHQLKLVLLLAIPLTFLITPTRFFENGPTLCPFRIITGIPCPGCGTTRAVSCIFQGDFTKAWEYNKLIIITFPLMTMVWLKYFYNHLKIFFRNCHPEPHTSFSEGSSKSNLGK